MVLLILACCDVRHMCETWATHAAIDPYPFNQRGYGIAKTLTNTGNVTQMEGNAKLTCAQSNPIMAGEDWLLHRRQYVTAFIDFKTKKLNCTSYINTYPQPSLGSMTGPQPRELLKRIFVDCSSYFVGVEANSNLTYSSVGQASLLLRWLGFWSTSFL